MMIYWENLFTVLRSPRCLHRWWWRHTWRPHVRRWRRRCAVTKRHAHRGRGWHHVQRVHAVSRRRRWRQTVEAGRRHSRRHCRWHSGRHCRRRLFPVVDLFPVLVIDWPAEGVEGLASALFTEFSKVNSSLEGSNKEINLLKSWRNLVAGHMAHVNKYLGIAESGEPTIFDDFLNIQKNRLGPAN